jgi:hypothetical protein
MKRKRLIQLAFVFFVTGFFVTGGMGLFINNLMHANDAGPVAKATQPATVPPILTRHTEPARPTAPKTVPATQPATKPRPTAPMPNEVVQPRNPNIPSDPELRQLVINTFLDFDSAKKNKDYTAFQSKMSAMWQTEDGKRNAQAYGQGITINLAQVKDSIPVLNPAPVLTDQGVLYLRGQVPAKTVRITFDFGYRLEQGTWKLHEFGPISWQGLNPM